MLPDRLNLAQGILKIKHNMPMLLYFVNRLFSNVKEYSFLMYYNLKSELETYICY